ncbi:hypothetical protein F2Q69_00059693 [Brassica cretica]|uniref:Uncharacterized protein n=1 Tax=Brassica cretica TaxID=69181 RepID=A0A8S9RRG8_BRACR|nr:hypothetical protein F2Q69_00059693 [Brassica cretica]
MPSLITVHAQQYQKQQGQTPAISVDPAQLEQTICKDQQSTLLDAASFTSTDSHSQPLTDTRPSSSTDLHRSTSFDTTPCTSIDHQSRNMVAIVILRPDENENLYDQDGHLRNATSLKIDAQGNVYAQQYQKQQGQTPAILRRSCSLGMNDPQRPTFHIARRSSFHVDRLSHPTVDRHPTLIVDRSTSFDIDRYYTAYID